MRLITVEKQTGAKRLHRKYTILNGDDFEFSCEHIVFGNTVEFEVKLEDEFKIEVEEFRTEQRDRQAKEARKANIVTIREIEAEQGTKEWLSSRIGIITASKTPFDSKGKQIPTYNAYVNEKVAEAFMKRNDGEPAEKYTNEAMQIGTDLEHYAIERYEEVSKNKVDQRSLLVADNLMLGASPDGVVIDDKGQVVFNIEVKSVLLKTYIGEIMSQTVTKRYNTQVQVQMYMLGCDETHLVTQCQEVSGQPLDIIISTIERDEEFISNMIETVKMYEYDFAMRYARLETMIIK